jgi:tryptophan 2-monooxygenase
MGRHNGIDKSADATEKPATPPGEWRSIYPNPADFDFNYWRLLDNGRGSSVGRNNKPKLRVAIIGAGIAGLTAARELFRSGYTNIDIYEASRRLGGRTYSLPVAGQHTVFEMGAMRLPFFAEPGSKNSVLDYYRDEFKITVQPFPNPGSPVADTGIFLNLGLGPEPSDHPPSSPQLLIWKCRDPLPPTPALKGVYNKWSHFETMFKTEVKKHYGRPGWEHFWHRIVSHYWSLNFRELVHLEALRAYDPTRPGYFGGLGMDEKEATLFRTIGAGDGPWGAFYDISCLYPIRTLLFGYGTNHQLIQGLFDDTGDFRGGPHLGEVTKDSVGGAFEAPHYLGVQSFAECMFFQPVISDLVPAQSLYDAMAPAQEVDGVHLFTRTPVSSIRRLADGRIRVLAGPMAREYDALILTPTTWAAQSIDVRGFDYKTQWPFEVQNSIKASHWITSCKVFYPLKERYWGAGKPIPQLISTDTRLQGVYGYALDTATIHDPGVLLVSYTWEDDANKLLADVDDESLARELLGGLDDTLTGCDNVKARISPYVDQSRPVVIQWARTPWYRGCAKLYRARSWDEDYALLRYNQDYSSESGLTFAGEGYSVEGGWMEPALRGGLDAVLHVIHNTGGTLLNGFDFRTYPRYSQWSPSNSCRIRLTPGNESPDSGLLSVA